MSPPLHPIEWPAAALDAVADAAMAEPVAIDWTRPIELDTVPPRPALVINGPDADGDFLVYADWPERDEGMNSGVDGALWVKPYGAVCGREDRDHPTMARVRNVAAMATDPRDALIAAAERRKIIDDLMGVYDRRVASRKGRRANQQDDFLAAVIQRIAGVDPVEAAMQAGAAKAEASK